MAEQFDPYRKWLGIPPAEQPAHHYRLLGVGLFETDQDVIQEAADRQMAHVQRHKLGHYASFSQKMLNELAAAKICLLNPDRKAAYDRQLRERLATTTLSAPAAPMVSPLGSVPPPAQVAVAPSAVMLTAQAGGTAFDIPDDARTTQTHARSRSQPGKGRPAKKKSAIDLLLVGGVIAAALAVVGFLVIDSKPQIPVAEKQAVPSHQNSGVTPKKPEKLATSNNNLAPISSHSVPSANNIDPDFKAQPTVAPAEKPATGGAEPTAVASTGLELGDVRDLMPLVRMNNRTASGKWQKSSKGLVLLASDNPFSRMLLPYAPPNEYQLELTVEPQPGAELILGLLAGGHQFAAILDGWGGSTSGLQLIDNAPGDKNGSTHQGHVLTARRPNIVLVTVRGDSVQVTCDDKQIINWRGSLDQLRLAPGQNVPEKRGLFLGGGAGTAFRIRSLRLATLSGRGEELTAPVVAHPDLARIEAPAEEPPTAPTETKVPTLRPTRVASQPQPAANRTAVPAKEELEAATKLIREIFADDFKQAKKPADRIALAEKLLKQSADSQSDPERYALLSEARNLAGAGGSPSLAIQIIEQTGNRFEIDVARETAHLAEQSANSLPTAARREIAEALLPLAEAAGARSDYETARRLLSAALQSARKTNDTALVKQVAARVAEVNEAKKAFDGYQKAVAKFETSPDDGDAHLAAGKYLCFAQQDWEQGLAHLAKGSDPALKEIAEWELKAPTSPEDQLKLADLWWALLEPAKGKEKTNYAERCDKWYSTALPGLKGLSQTKVSKRIEELAFTNKATTPAIAAGGGTTTAPKSIAARIKHALKKETLQRSQLAGGGVGTAYFEVPPAGAVLAGLNITFLRENGYLTSVQGVYWGPRGIVTGEVAGNASGPPTMLMAKKGYAVAGICVSASYDIFGMQLIFAKLTEKGLDLTDKYSSEWVGSTNYAERTVGDKSGQPSVGVFGTGNRNSLTGVGLVQLPAAE